MPYYVPCSFSDGISKYEFSRIVKNSIKKNDRIAEIKIFDAKIYGLILSQTGKTSWRFILDFNDNGHLTGMFHVYTHNSDSQIPELIGEDIKKALLLHSVGIRRNEL